jgi:hypothetical protein
VKLNRNALCHCGSGKKYKRCHLRTDSERSRAVSKLATPARWLKFFAVELESSLATRAAEDATVQEAARAWGTGPFADTFAEPLFRQHAIYDLSTPPLVAQGTTTNTADPKRLDALKTALGASHQTLLEVTECKRGRGIRLADRLDGTDRFVADPDLAGVLQPMEVIVGRLAEFEERNVLVEGWEKVYFRGRKAAIADLRTQMDEAGLAEDDADARRAWLTREAPTVTRRAREATPR